MRSISAVRARVAELEALVHQRKIRDDRRLGGEGHGGPVVVAGRPEVVSLHAPVDGGPEPVNCLAPRRLDGREPDPSARQPLGDADPKSSRLEPSDELFDEPDRLANFQRAHRHARVGVAVLDGRDAQVGRRGARNAPWGWARRASRFTPLARAPTPTTARSSAAWWWRTPVSSSRSTTDGLASMRAIRPSSPPSVASSTAATSRRRSPERSSRTPPGITRPRRNRL